LVYKEFVEVSPDSFTDRPLLLSCLKGEVFYTLPVGKAIEFISYEELDVKQKKRVSQYFAKQALPPLCRKALPLPLLEQRVLRLESVFFPWQEENARVLLLKI
jgi:polyphosphate kinase